MQKLYLCNQEIYSFTSSYIEEEMYILLSQDKALVIDPHYSAEVLTFLEHSNVRDVTVLLTHEHPDHTNGVPMLQEHFKTKIICQENCAKAVKETKNNQPQILEMILAFQDEKNGTHTADKFIAQRKNFANYTLLADIVFDKTYQLLWQGQEFFFYATPGHTTGSCCIVWNNKVVFTGDSLLKDMPVITRFPGGSTKQYNAITKPYLDSLPDDMVVLPGHGCHFTMKELRENAT